MRGCTNFTMTPDNVRETNSVVDVGFHYAVVSDGIGDYLQDLDQDGMADVWENQYFGNLSRDETGDYDGDGVSDLLEFLLGTDPAARIDLVVYTQLK